MHYSVCIGSPWRFKWHANVLEEKYSVKAKQVAPLKLLCLVIYHKLQTDVLDNSIHSWFFYKKKNLDTACTESIWKLVCASCHPCITSLKAHFWYLNCFVMAFYSKIGHTHTHMQLPATAIRRICSFVWANTFRSCIVKRITACSGLTWTPL